MKIVFSILLVLCSSFSVAEIEYQQDSITELQLVDQFERRINRAIEAYLGHDRFIANIDVQVRKQIDHGETEVYEAYVNRQKQAANEIVALLARQKELEQAKEQIPLPGLARGQNLDVVLQDEEALAAIEQAIAKQQAILKESPPKVEIKAKVLNSQIDFIRITLVLDDQTTQAQELFIKNLVQSKLDLDFFRGDKFGIVRDKFAQPEAPVDTTEEAKMADNNSTLLSWLEFNWMWLLLALLVLVVLLIALKGRRGSKPVEQSGKTSWQDIVKMEPVEANQADLVSTKQAEINQLKQDIISILVADNQKARALIDELATNDQRVAILGGIKYSLGESMFNSLLPNANAALQAEVNEYLDEQSISASQQFDALFTVKQMLLSNRQGVVNSQRPFEFLNKLSDEQVLYLLKDEPVKIRALALSQMVSDRSAKLINRYSEADKGAIALEITRFEQLPVAAFRAIADRLARASIDLPSFENMNAQGTDMLIKMFDNMATKDEQQLLNQIKEQDPESYYRIRQTYFTFDDFARMSKEQIADMVRNFNRQQLAYAIAGASKELQGQMFAALPDKLKLAVKSELEQDESIEVSLVDKAQHALVSHVREQISAGRLQLKDLAAIA